VGMMRTLKDALYGRPIGRLAKMASSRLANGERKARLWDISWIARKRFWFAVAPKTYAVAQNFHDQNGVSRRAYASAIWSETTSRTVYLVINSGPHSFVTWSARMLVAEWNAYRSRVRYRPPDEPL
jgi:hypothetical protein